MDKMRPQSGSGTWKFVAVLIGLVLMGGVVWKFFDSIPYGGNFALHYKDTKWQFSDAPKKMNLVYFGFTKCGDVCPVSMSKAGTAFRQLTPEERKNVRLIFVSVDAQHDTPEDAARFAEAFFPEFIGLTGSEAEIDKAIKKFPAGYIIENNPESHLGYTITHPDKFFFVDEKGKMINNVKAAKDARELLSKIREYL